MERPFRPRAGTCRFLAAFLALVVSLAAVAPHSSCAAHSFGVAEEESFSHAAVHPGQPLHFEASEIVKRPVCEICLLRLQTAGIRLVAAASCGVPSASGVVSSETAPVPCGLSRLSRPARAPPIA
ncbi:MAG TPA: hypothetical protein VH988_16490 [Thermoanaerobaculia bacterium]|jgi:hypothetical protein|nr:hypothetical protein [Thermoanaerobaculia bacterium]